MDGKRFRRRSRARRPGSRDRRSRYCADPNIATIHGLEQSEGSHYLVMELVLGETLAERLRAGTLSVKEALRICGRIASASGMTSVRASSRYRSRPG